MTKKRTTGRDPYEIAIDQILEGAEGDVRLALRTVLIQNLKLEAELFALCERTAGEPNPKGKQH
jgi:hypothetical protein